MASTTSTNPFLAILGYVDSPTGLAVIESFGHFLSTLAAHNKATLGSATATVSTIGTAISEAPAVLSAVEGLEQPPA
jgi:hypothetical protein